VAGFHDRREAGAALGARLARELPPGPTVVLGLPRGGIPVAAEVATALDAPLDVFVVRKLGVPGHRELAMGAIASGGVRVLNQSVVDGLRIDAGTIEAVAREEQRELERREHAYRGDRAPVDRTGQRIVLVDDGLATGATMRAAVEALRHEDTGPLVIAVPTGARQTCAELSAAGDLVVCLESPEPYHAVGLSYTDFSETSDDEVRRLLTQTMR
jgi:putative phosphoribosyl transferase